MKTELRLGTEHLTKLYDLAFRISLSFLHNNFLYLYSGQLSLFRDISSVLGRYISLKEEKAAAADPKLIHRHLTNLYESIYVYEEVDAQATIEQRLEIFFREIQNKIDTICTQLSQNSNKVVLQDTKILLQDAVKDFLSNLFTKTGIQLNVGGNCPSYFLKFIFASSLQKFHFLYKWQPASDANTELEMLENALCQRNEEQHVFVSDIKVDVGDYHRATFVNSERREKFLNFFEIPEGISKEGEDKLAIIDVIKKARVIEFKNPKMGNDFCIFTSAVLREGVKMDPQLTEIVFDYLYNP